MPKNRKRKGDKQMKEKNQKTKGITLIALVITIVLNCYRSGQKLECAM